MNETEHASRIPATVIIGSACFWAWGFLTFLSPSIAGPSPSPAAHIEYAYIVSQVTLIVIIGVMVWLIHRRTVKLGRSFIVSMGVALAASTVVLWALSADASITRLAMVATGIVIGCTSPFIGIAWGARFSLEGPRIYPAIASSFCLAYLMYFFVNVLGTVVQPVAALVTAMLPLASTLCWYAEARSRQILTDAVWPVIDENGQPETPGELLAGDTSLSLLPKRDISILAIAALIGNLLPSIILEYNYPSAGDICLGAFLLAIALAMFTLALAMRDGYALPIARAYRIVLPFTAIGLLILLVSRDSGVSAAGAIVMGSGLFLQVLIYIKMTEATRDKGFSPVLSFGVGQAIVATSVAVGNLLGKIAYAAMPGNIIDALAIISALSLLLLIFLLTFLFEWKESHKTDSEAPPFSNHGENAPSKELDAEWGGSRACIRKVPQAHGPRDRSDRLSA